MTSLTRGQWLGIAVIIVSVLATSTTQLTDIFGPVFAAKVTAGASLLTAILGGIITVITGQAGLIQQVKSMAGVENIQINDKAPKAIAVASLDPGEDKLEPGPGLESSVRGAALK